MPLRANDRDYRASIGENASNCRHLGNSNAQQAAASRPGVDPSRPPTELHLQAAGTN